MPSVLIIITTYNGAGHIRQCLTSYDVRNQDVSCMIVDNGSTDDTVKIIRNEYPAVRLVENGENLGFGAANNIGLRYALDKGYDYVYLLNQDAWVEPDDIMKLIDIAEQHPNYGIVSPLQVYACKEKVDNNFSGKISKEIMDDFLISGNTPKDIYLIKNRSLQAAHWLMRTSAIKKVGGFSPSYFLYGEDTNLCRRIQFHGIDIGIAPRILGIHDRQHRKNPHYYYLHLTLVNWIHCVSDPDINFNRIKELIINITYSFKKYKFKILPFFFRFIKNLPTYKKNRLNSIKTIGPFL